MKTILSLSIVILTAGSLLAGDPAPSPTPPNTQTIIEMGEGIARAGNFSLAVSPGYAPKLGKGEWGLAILGGYQINQYAGAYLRADLFDGNYTVASGSVSMQYPIVLGKITVRPFVQAGIGSTLSGAGEQNNQIFAVAGGGIAADVWHSKDGRQSLSVLGAIETWEPTYSGVSIYRAGMRYGISF